MFSLYIKKSAYLSSLILLLAALLMACSTNTNHQEPSNSDQVNLTKQEQSPSTETAEHEHSTHTITDALGRQVEVPANPQRIIAHYFASEIVALDAPLVGTNFINAQEILTDEQLQGVEDIGQDMAPNLEKTLSLNPDLIIVPDFLESPDIEKLSKIAPTVVVSYSAEVFTRLRSLGEIIGKSEQAEEWIKNYTAKAEEMRNQLKSEIKQGETASAFIIYGDKQLYLYGPQRLGPTMYDAFGFKMPPKVAELFANDQDLWKTISLETFPEYAGDRIFLVSESSDDAAKKELEKVINGPIWKNLPAVKNGKAYIVEDRWGYNDPLTLEWLLDEMAKVLTK